ncbi:MULTISPECIES: DUF4054 domain-containing protein [unclassified Rhodanobacter]|uniref:DUF4054 domain-containing protein n=1 Tax=unclassified Rhodanobacter TaxID=2621553 RepID=UPI001BDDF082|nr:MULTISPECIES: DUF4054 domain-containing protein [unclassified Rhodanobacter]MBT2142687.1 DUF4054 domain-containing protein [Rhodanobacter sp. LX-99]MBT2148240.1 DUF4054 domain-containing protein [Rhodanobacter sp. LX-100]
MDVTQFRTDFPEFTDATTYPDGSVTFWLNVASISLPEARWGAWWNLGQELFVAHHLVLAAQAVQDAAISTPGEVTGPTTAKAVDKVSVSMDASAVTLEDGGFWNMTRYGIQLLQFARMCGTGGMQFGGC